MHIVFAFTFLRRSVHFLGEKSEVLSLIEKMRKHQCYDTKKIITKNVSIFAEIVCIKNDQNKIHKIYTKFETDLRNKTTSSEK
jgi:hypothetical protein